MNQSELEDQNQNQSSGDSNPNPFDNILSSLLVPQVPSVPPVPEFSSVPPIPPDLPGGNYNDDNASNLNSDSNASSNPSIESPKVTWTCPICSSNDVYPMVIVPCGHTLCEHCADRIGKATSCPLCRSLILDYVSNFALAELIGQSRGHNMQFRLPNMQELKQQINSTISRSSDQITKIVEIYSAFISYKMEQSEKEDISLITIRFRYTYDEFSEFLDEVIPQSSKGSNLPTLWSSEFWKPNLQMLFDRMLTQLGISYGCHLVLPSGQYQVEFLRSEYKNLLKSEARPLPISRPF